MPEVSDAQLEELSKAYRLLQMLHGNPSTRRDLERLAKTVNPKAVTTEDEAAPYLKEIREELETLREFKNSVLSDQKAWQENEAFGRLSKAGYTEDGIDAIKKIMKEKNVSDPEIAAAYFDKTKSSVPVVPNGLSPSAFDFQNSLETEKERNQALWEDSDRYVNMVASEIFNGASQTKGV